MVTTSQLPEQPAHLDASIIIVSYRTGAVLLRALEAALAQPALREVILVDHGNDDAVMSAIKVLRAKHETLVHITGHGNIGFAAGCNLGAARATGDYVLFLNPDCVLEPDSLRPAISAMNEHKNAWLAGANIKGLNGAAEPTNRRKLLTPQIALAHAFMLHKCNRALSLNMPACHPDEEPHIVPAISGAFMLMKRERYSAVGGLDEGYFLHVEDLDLCKRVNVAGGKILFLPQISPRHHTSSSSVSSAFVEWHKTKGFIRYFNQHYTGQLPYGTRHLLSAAFVARYVIKLPLYATRLLWKHAISRVPNRNALQLRAWHRAAEHAPTKSDKLQLKANSPLIVSGAMTPIGISLISRAIAADLSVCACYHHDSLPITHPKLHWSSHDFNVKQLRFAPHAFKRKPRTLVHTLPIWMLPDHVEQLANLGINRIIAFSSTSATSKANSASQAERVTAKRLKSAEKKLISACKAHQIDYTIFRPTLIYGAGLDQNVTKLARFLKRFHFLPITPPANGLRMPVHYDDLAEACLQALLHDQTNNKIYTLSGGETLSYHNMITAIASTLGQTPRMIKLTFLPKLLDILPLRTINGAMAQRMNKDLVFDSDPAKKAFGYNGKR